MDLLPFNAVHVDLVHPDDPDAWSQHEAYLALLSPEEHDRMARLVFERDRRRFLLTRALVRTMLSRYAGVAPAEWTFIANVHGRPEILDRPQGVPDLRFNLSHTEGLIACAVTIGREVGVDVEHIQRRLTRDVAGRFFAPSEVNHLKSAGGRRASASLLRLLDAQRGVHQGAGLRACLTACGFRVHALATGAATDRVRARAGRRPGHLAVRAGLAHTGPSAGARGAARGSRPAGAYSHGRPTRHAEVNQR